jgi:hypothetical protein
MSKIAPMQAAALEGKVEIAAKTITSAPVKAAVTKPVVSKPAMSKPAMKKPLAKSIAKPKSPAVRKPVVKTKPAAKVKPTTKVKPQKVKMERDSFTMPKEEYAQLTLLKARLTTLGQPAKKSELLRAGIKLLVAMSDNTLKTTLAKIPVIKTGRPKKK